MSSKSRIHTYLVKNKISELFEEMMAKLVHDLPSNPVAYLSDMLKKKHQASQKILETKPILGQGSPVRSKSATLNLWSESDTPSPDKHKLSSTLPNKKDFEGSNKTGRQYNKPWLSHSKKSPTKDSKALSQSMPASTKPLWDRNAKSSQDLTQNETTVDGDADLRLIYAKPKIFGQISDNSSGLESEISSKHSDNKPDKTLKSQKPSKNVTQSKDQRRKALKAMVEKENMKNRTQTAEDAPESEDDETIEICEDFDDLHNEGVKSPPKGGVHTTRNLSHRKEEIELVLNMSKFFDSLGGAVSPMPEISAKQDISPEIEDDFESASQVTGPRHPVWETPESDADSTVSRHSSLLARRLNANMFDISNSTEARTKSQISKDNMATQKTTKERAGSAAYRAAEARKNKAAATKPKAVEDKTSTKIGGGSRAQSVVSNKGSISHRSNRSSIERPKTAQ
uniref:Uncharacterized protein C8orf34 homolog n=1 Tax=Phallusia mammillata TaxID=59560 RepID=A0A6F9D8W7_9ASCI|nr:uncharacterized protein C8orf34 homolog [Phallusia mammillata]